MVSNNKHWYVADPVHQMLHFGDDEKCVKAIVQHEAFQRLRRISQLGLASCVFPGAVHTRFNHSLGAAYLATRVGTVLSPWLLGEETTAVVVAALLHDIGHGPFSHSFERAMVRILGKDRTPKHEAWTKSIVATELVPLLDRFKVDPQVVCALITGDIPGSSRHLHQIVSSQLDVDRMDYLCRDAHFAGVPVGAIDVQYLIPCLRVIDHGTQKTLGIISKGIPAYEAFAFARHTMNKTVYYHRQVATFECMMEECIQALVDDQTSHGLPRFLEELRAHKSSTRDEVLAALKPSYLQLTEDQIWTLLAQASSQGTRAGRLAKRLVQRQPLPSRRVVAGKHEILKKVLEDAGYTDVDFAICSPRTALYEQEANDQVFVVNEERGGSDHISQVSSIVDSLRDRFEIRPVLVVLAEEKKDAIFRCAREADCLQTRYLGAQEASAKLPKKTSGQSTSVGTSVAKTRGLVAEASTKPGSGATGGRGGST